MKKSSILLASAVAGLLTVGAVAQVQAAEGQKVPCWGANKCKGTGACGGKNHSCAGRTTAAPARTPARARASSWPTARKLASRWKAGG
jgi:hypothetical protein